MKRGVRALGLALVLCLTLSGCADLLKRSYEVSAPHVDRPAIAEDPSALQVKDYTELVSAVFYLVSQGEETGSIRMVDYHGDVETDLTAACLEVATEDPLGAYCVDYIKHEAVRVVSYDQATLTIQYRRTPEQVASMVRVTGTGAIRTELREALAGFAPEVVLRVAYFDGDADSIAGLVRQAYYDNPAAAFGFPQVEIALYPETGRERVVEILLTYPAKTEVLVRRQEDLAAQTETLARSLRGLSGQTAALRAAQTLWTAADFDSEGEDTPYAALVDGAANDLGLALAYELLCQQGGLSCQVVEGTLILPPREETGERELRPHFWNMLTLSGTVFYLDPAQEGSALRTAQEIFDLGYRWPGGPEEPEAEPQSQEETETKEDAE